MGKLQVSVACAMLMVFDKSMAKLICSMCEKGHYVTRNCSLVLDAAVATRCSPCRICSELSQEIQSPCSQYSDTVCRNRTDVAAGGMAAGCPEPTGVPPIVWILTAIFASMLLLALLALYFKLMFFKAMAELPSTKSSISEMTEFSSSETWQQVCVA